MTPSQHPLKVVPKKSDEQKLCIKAEGLSICIDDSLILNDVNLNIYKNAINCIIGPSGAGKSTLIRSFNRINEEVDGLQTKGSIHFNDDEIHSAGINKTRLRTQIGMVFQKPAVFPKSIKENILLGIKHHKKLAKLDKAKLVEKHLKAASLWKEVSHRLDEKAHSLSAGQQQRLCLARTLAVEPKVLLMDEPTSSLDPISSKAIEDLMLSMKKDYTIVFVTHNIQQAKRIADYITFMCDGEVIESGTKDQMFNSPQDRQTRQYLTDNYCDC